MRFVYAAALSCFLGSVSATGSDGCNADNCLRAIRASSFPTRSGVADCGSYLAATVTPGTSTIYSTVVAGSLPTVSVVTGNIDVPPATPVTVYPTSIPTYASACSGSVRYSSACSCVGVSQSTITVATPTTTVYVTACTLPSPTAEACGTVMTGPNSRQYQVECGLAYTGSSSLSSGTVGSYQECFNACAGSSACGSFTFDSAQCTNNCQLFGVYDATTVVSSDTANSGFTPGTARDGTCGTGICGAAVLGGTSYQDSYLVACRSSYSFAQGSDVAGSPFTATSFLDCLRQCDNIYGCNYMSFDSSKFSGNCAMFSRGGVSSDVLASSPSVDSAKALVNNQGPAGVELVAADASQCPAYGGGAAGAAACSRGDNKTPLHPTGYSYTAACGVRYTPKDAGTGVCTLTVNTYAQCFDACDKNNHCDYMTFAGSSISLVDNCQFFKGAVSTQRNAAGYDSLFYPHYCCSDAIGSAVGIGVLVRDCEGRVVLGKRKASIGKGEWGFPGGHLEYGESIFECAERETLEETGLKVKGVKTIGVTSTVFPELQKHYITLFVLCEREDEKQEPELLEPEKCEGWSWLTWKDLRAMAEEDSPQKAFRPIINFLRENPNIEELVKV
ncbi:uncharacterized protein E0L32_004010 [Thyridium curvatum]|uniref:Nudix hydrolase domain-containing protein n=1 Tax=Thyridium curvatum TaxID=1093900 RepID=A0A507BH90_9PEZI|nr:uncharacterized protein E0L32_004010 [Thyridium curvatum]TPX16361.1 hypothetical protein E0L32_004010 [Thyridium curvatum]